MSIFQAQNQYAWLVAGPGRTPGTNAPLFLRFSAASLELNTIAE